MGIKVKPIECLSEEVFGLSIEGKGTLCRHSQKEVISLVEEVYSRFLSTIRFNKEEYKKAGECPSLIDLKRENLKPLEVFAHESAILPARV